MYASQLARSAYSPRATAPRPHRRTEYDAFARITAALKAAVTPTGLVAALHDNRQLWTVLAVDVADGANGLPQPLRARIFYLAEFTAQHTSKVLAGDATHDVLIEINTAMMRGLNQRDIPQ